MVKLPRIRRPRLTGWPKLPLPSSVRGRIITGFGLGVLVVASGAAGSAWLTQAHQSHMADMEDRAAIADLLQDAQVNATLANLLLERYLVAGNEEAVPVIRSSAAHATENIAEARALEEPHGHEPGEAGSAEAELERLDELAAGAAALSETFEQVITLRQSGDEQGARQTLEAATPEITAFGIQLGETTQLERQEIPALRSRSDRTADLALWFTIIAGAFGALLGLAASAYVARSILKPLSSLESAALAVAGGDLEARAPATGPRELARLGASLNRMTESLLDASKRRELEEARERAYTLLRESEERTRLIVETAHDAFVSMDARGVITAWNAQAETVFGWSHDEALGRTLADMIIPAQLREAYSNGLRHFLATGEGPLLNRRIEITALHRDGHEFPVELAVWVVGSGDSCTFNAFVHDITERKRAEEALRLQSEMMKNMAEAVYLIRASDGVIVYTNPAFERLFGYDPGEMVGKHVSVVNAPTDKDPEETAKEIAAVLDRTGVWRGEILNIKKDGTPFWSYANVSTFDRPEHGTVWVTYHTDITERKRAEEALRESEEWLSTTLTSIGDAVIATDRDGRVTFLNPVAQSLTGWKREEAAGMPLTDMFNIVSEQTGKPAENPVARVIREGAVVGLGNDTVLIAKNGTRRPIEDSAAPIRDSQGGMIGVVLVFHDVSERRRAERAIREADEKYRTLVKQANDYIIILQHGKAVYLNPSYAKLLGYTAAETADRSFLDFVAPEDRARVQGYYQNRLRGEPVPDQYEVRVLTKDGRRVTMEVKPRVIQYRGEPATMVIQRDITDRKRAEEELWRANQQLAKDRQEIEALNRSLEARVTERTQELRSANEELHQRNRQLLDARAQAATDALTGLRNHRAFHERVREEARRAQDSGSPLSLIMMDIDSFKRINDSLGHQAGDDILRALANTLADVAPRQNTYRYGGDEFAVLLSGADARKTARVAERLRRAVEREVDGSGEKVTVSLGIASFPDMAASAEELVYGADAAMYWAKSAGKNRVGDWSKLLGQREGGALPWYAADRGVKAPDVVAALTAALAAKDPTTAGHTERCSWYALKLAEELGLPEEGTSVVRLASLLHDIGKLAIRDEVLFKPGPLNEEEWAQMKQHPTAALHVLSHIRSLTDATPAILHHHEHFDGSGYPDGVAGEDIPIASRILLVTDAFDAMTTDRPYREAMPIEAAIEELKRNRGSQFDPAVVDAFLRVLARHGAQPLRRMAAARARPVAAGAAGSRRSER